MTTQTMKSKLSKYKTTEIHDNISHANCSLQLTENAQISDVRNIIKSKI